MRREGQYFLHCLDERRSVVPALELFSSIFKIPVTLSVQENSIIFFFVFRSILYFVRPDDFLLDIFSPYYAGTKHAFFV